MGADGSLQSSLTGFQIKSVPRTQIARMGEYFALNGERARHADWRSRIEAFVPEPKVSYAPAAVPCDTPWRRPPHRPDVFSGVQVCMHTIAELFRTVL